MQPSTAIDPLALESKKIRDGCLILLTLVHLAIRL
jgi:hypothetical protein